MYKAVLNTYATCTTLTSYYPTMLGEKNSVWIVEGSQRIKIASEMPVPQTWGNSFQHHEIQKQ